MIDAQKGDRVVLVRGLRPVFGPQRTVHVVLHATPTTITVDGRRWNRQGRPVPRGSGRDWLEPATAEALQLAEADELLWRIQCAVDRLDTSLTHHVWKVSAGWKGGMARSRIRARVA